MVQGKVKVSTTLNIRNAPNGKVISSLKNGDIVNIDRKTGEWYSIYFGTNGGYVSAKYIELLPILGVVTASTLNIREHPNTTCKVLGSLKKGTTVKIDLNYINIDWYSIFYGNHGGYVSKKYIDTNISTHVKNSGMVTSKLVDFVKSYEGFYSKKYLDCVGIQTIGYGSTHGWIINKNSVTEAEATQALLEEISSVARQIKNNLDNNGVKLTQPQFDALCSFSYNCGVGALLGSTLYKRICSGVRDTSLKDNFTAWCKAGGREIKGLKNRRIEEFQIFMYGDYKRNL